MSDLEKADKLLRNFICDLPNLSSGKNGIGQYVKKIKDSYDISCYKTLLDSSYNEFEIWLNNLLDNEKLDNDILALNFGLYEAEESIQLYMTGSREWDCDDEGWASHNDYFPEGRYLRTALYNNLYAVLQSNFEMSLFLYIATTIMFINTYAEANSEKLLEEKEFIIFATGFDDGDLYSFSKLTKDGIEAMIADS